MRDGIRPRDPGALVKSRSPMARKSTGSIVIGQVVPNDRAPSKVNSEPVIHAALDRLTPDTMVPIAGVSRNTIWKYTRSWLKKHNSEAPIVVDGEKDQDGWVWVRWPGPAALRQQDQEA